MKEQKNLESPVLVQCKPSENTPGEPGDYLAAPGGFFGGKTPLVTGRLITSDPPKGAQRNAMVINVSGPLPKEEQEGLYDILRKIIKPVSGAKRPPYEQVDSRWLSDYIYDAHEAEGRRREQERQKGAQRDIALINASGPDSGQSVDSLEDFHEFHELHNENWQRPQQKTDHSEQITLNGLAVTLTDTSATIEFDRIDRRKRIVSAKKDDKEYLIKYTSMLGWDEAERTITVSKEYFESKILTR